MPKKQPPRVQNSPKISKGRDLCDKHGENNLGLTRTTSFRRVRLGLSWCAQKRMISSTAWTEYGIMTVGLVGFAAIPYVITSA